MRPRNLDMARRIVAALLVAQLAGPPVVLESAPSLGRVQGTVTLEGRPLSGVDVALVDIESGSIYRTRSTTSGAFELRLAPGQYSVATESRTGLAVGRAPAIVPVRGGQVASASIELLAVPDFPQETSFAQDTAPLPEGAPVSISHEAVGCLIAGEFPLIDAVIEPSASVARVRLFFKGAGNPDYFFVEFGALEGRFVAKMPKPTLAASPVSYYIQAVSTDGAEVQSPEIQAEVVENANQCPDRKVAAIGPPGDVTVFSAATGSAIKPIGFVAGGALTIGAIALVIAALAGVAAAITVLNPSPTPSPTAEPPTPPPTTVPPPTPSPSPTATPTPPGPGSPVKF